MPKVTKSVRISTKGQVVIPLEVRRQLGIRPGDSLVIVGGMRKGYATSAC